MIFPDNIHALILNSNKEVTNLDEYVDEAIKGLQQLRKEVLENFEKEEEEDEFDSYFQDYDDDDD